ncbi:TIGR02449 family protein [Dasania marina]|uniref:TIGR02449 family protein n=1 Tax=Dasania marina TaxID=471499 RepID=UPI00036C25E1|nr:TIGR02449 family protein [Dasania marina]|tara:strand:+ start:19959 stop:20168 length:210 start_codon:yes stop_codon:yes gene_type:complete
MDNHNLKALSKKIEGLIEFCGQLDSENRKLKAEAIGWQQEREQLIEKTETARNRVEAMITKLKAIEQES